MKRIIAYICALILCLSCSTAAAARKKVVKDRFYIGAMRVVNCKEYVSLRATPDKTGAVLAQVPLGSIVLYCNNNVRKYTSGKYKKQAELFIRCEFDGQEGYILKKNLQRAPEYEPAETKQSSKRMTRKQIIGKKGKVILEWNEFNVSVLAAYEKTKEDGAVWEYVRIGCFINNEPAWGYTEAVKLNDKPITLKAFMGGSDDEPAVYVYDEAYGLSMLDLIDGTEVWTIPRDECSFGNASATAAGQESGVLYIAGKDGPDPIAVDADGTILWRADIDDPEVFEPKGIVLNPDGIEVKYGSGKTVILDYDGTVVSIKDL